MSKETSKPRWDSSFHHSFKESAAKVKKNRTGDGTRHGIRASIFSTVKCKEDLLAKYSIAGFGKKGSTSKYSIGTTYKGEWKNNKKHGFGAQVWACGNKYEGCWENGKRHGNGSFWEMKGQQLRKTYAGNWAKGLRDGLGVAFYDNNDRYEGQWKKGVCEGKGTLFMKNGDQYNGMWRQGKQTGFGRLVKANGDVYRGYWLNGKREGNGIFYYKEKGRLYDGEWVNDMPKAGIYADAKEYLSKKSNAAINIEAKFHAIPELKLKDADKILIKRIEEIEAERFAVRNIEYVELAAEFSEDDLDELREVYSQVDTDGNGSVSFSEMKTLMVRVGLPVEENDLQTMMADLDKDKNSLVSFQEFVRGVHFIRHAFKQEAKK